jgi:1,5-anhydro-D-fructose reductase (1,5-anhydro-D-mannitol-forming)
MVNFGIVGFGLHAVKRLMPGFAGARNCRVTALARRDEEKAQQSAARFGIPHAFTSVEELCQSSSVDAVLVTSPNSLHLPDVLTAVRHRKHVLCEKPMAMNAEECRQMVTAARKANVLLGVAHVFRFHESTARLKERIVSGHIGKPVFARADFSFVAGEHPRKWLTDRSVAGGGPIADVGIHCIDALRYVLDDEVIKVTALTDADEAAGEVESAAAVALHFSRGTLATISASYRATYYTPVSFHGANGVLMANDGLTVERPVTINLWRDGSVAESETVSNHLSYIKQVEEFADAVEGKAAFCAPGEQGWQNQVILDAAYRSAATGTAVEVERIPVIR